MSLGVDSGRVSCAPGDCTPQTSRTTPTVAATHARVGRRLRRPISISEAPLVFMSSATGDHVLRLDRRGHTREPLSGELMARGTLVPEYLLPERCPRRLADSSGCA